MPSGRRPGPNQSGMPAEDQDPLGDHVPDPGRAGARGRSRSSAWPPSGVARAVLGRSGSAPSGPVDEPAMVARIGDQLSQWEWCALRRCVCAGAVRSTWITAPFRQFLERLCLKAGFHSHTAATSASGRRGGWPLAGRRVRAPAGSARRAPVKLLLRLAEGLASAAHHGPGGLEHLVERKARRDPAVRDGRERRDVLGQEDARRQDVAHHADRRARC